MQHTTLEISHSERPDQSKMSEDLWSCMEIKRNKKWQFSQHLKVEVSDKDLPICSSVINLTC